MSFAPASNEVYADEGLPQGSVVDALEGTAAVEESYDFVVIGSGAAGAVAAHTLAQAGHSVAIVEEGAWVKTRDFGEGVYDSFKRMMRDAGTQVLTGRAYMPLLQGRCVGGSTVVNSAIAWRTPGDVLDDWSKRFGLGSVLTERALEPHFRALESDLNVHAVFEEALGENNRLFLEHGRVAGYAPRAIERFDSGCKGSGRCLTGCPHAAKQGMSVTYVPWALKLGARIYTSTRVDKIVIASGRAVGVLASSSPMEDGTTRRIHLHARRGVFVAASTVQSPVLLMRSRIRSRALGEHFQVHPGLALAGVFAKPVQMNFGATQGAESIAFRKSDRFKLETISMPPELIVSRMPGIGGDLMERLAAYPYVGIWAAQIRAEAEGTVRATWGGKAHVRFSMTSADMMAARKACGVIARLFFDAGAREVWPGIHGVPSVIKSRDDVRFIDEGPLDARAYAFIATHLFGAARMGDDPRTSVVGLDFGVHGVSGLYVVDSSVFPTNLGVNPQHSIMAMSRLAATHVAHERVVAKMRAPS